MTDPNESDLINLDEILSLAQNDTKQKLLSETSKIGWHELQRFFAAGATLYVDASLDLIEIGSAMANDDATTLKPHVERNLIRAVKDKEALEWYENNSVLWALVVRPWILVQLPE